MVRALVSHECVPILILAVSHIMPIDILIYTGTVYMYSINKLDEISFPVKYGALSIRPKIPEYETPPPHNHPITAEVLHDVGRLGKTQNKQLLY